MLEVNQLAPAFIALNQDGEAINLSDFTGKQNIVLYFYPKDDTPGCTIEANQFTSLAGDFRDNDTMIFGVSKDSCESHRDFIHKYGLNVQLLSDPDGKLCELYDTWQAKEKNGVTKMGNVRSTFIINKEGIIKHAEYGVTADGHALAILNMIKAL